MRKKVLFNWSGGKDSSMALHQILENPELEVCCLFTVVNEQYQRISMHGVRKELLMEQAKSIDLPLEILYLPETPSMEEYELCMRERLMDLRKIYSFDTVVFGDIFLEDLRSYREDKLQELAINALFPLWKKDTHQLATSFCTQFKAILCCTSDAHLDPKFCGKELTRELLLRFPSNIDPCGENGEYHSFVYDGPIFNYPIPFQTGEKVTRSYSSTTSSNSTCSIDEDAKAPSFTYIDLLPIS